MTESNMPHQAQKLAEGITYGGGFAWLATNSSAITALVVLVTGITSIYFGMANRKVAMRNAKANEERNRINKVNVFNEALADLDEDRVYTLKEIRNQIK